MITRDAVWSKLLEVTRPFESYKDSLQVLSNSLPPGYSLCFAFHYVDAEIINGGISQLYKNETWCLMLTAIKACEQVKSEELERLLKEIVLYYHQKGRSRLKRQLPSNFFDGIDYPMNKTLSQLEDEFYAREKDAEEVLLSLIKEEALW